MNARIFWIALLIIVFPFNARGQGKIRGFYDALPPEMKRPSTHVPRMEVVMGLQKVEHGITEIGIDMRGGLGFEGNHTIAIIGIDGSLEYYGPDKRAHILGPHSGSVNQRILNKLCQLIVESGFMDMDNNYSQGPTDGDVTYTMVLCNGKRKVVRNYFGSDHRSSGQ